MPCYTPLTGYQAVEVNPQTGKRPITFKKDVKSYSGRAITLPCGKCIGCRRKRLFDWVIRLGHEQSFHEHSYFVTLTYNDDTMPKTEAGFPTLRPADMQGFMKRLRNRVGQGVRFFGSGEYSPALRPHLHVILFGPDFGQDPVRFRRIAERGHDTFFSRDVHEAWEYRGIISMSELTPERCAYTAKYTTDKLDGDRGKAFLERVGGDGVVSSVAPEFALMSRGGRGGGFGGIGRRWIENPTYAHQSLVHQDIHLRGRDYKFALPKSYQRFLSEDPDYREDYEFYRTMKRREATALRLAQPLEYSAVRMREKHEIARRSSSEARARRRGRKAVK